VGAAFTTIAGRIKPAAKYRAAVGAQCPKCGEPVAIVLSNKEMKPHHEVSVQLGKFLQEPHGPEITGLLVADVWPKPPEPSVPAHIPPAIQRAMLQAERNYPIAGNEEASAMMYRRSLELALKDKFPALTGTLAARIKRLVADKTLPTAMGDWADEIRDLGNDAAHEPDEVERPQLTMIRGFTDATLRYLYTLPAEIEARRKIP
jgi:Domain of unknown function (DUF4145)